MSSEFDAGIESFPWDSEDQKKGYLALIGYLRQFGIDPVLPIDYKAAFFIQKNIDSHCYWRDLVGGQVTSLQDTLAETRGALDEALSRIDQLEFIVRTQMTAIESLTAKY